MNIAMDKLSLVFSHGLDIIEQEQIGATQHHCARAAALCAAMGRHLGYDDDTVLALSTCALFHDNALTQYNLTDEEIATNGKNMLLHCEKGQSNVSWLPFEKSIDGFILYHHERGDGSGPYHKREGQYPFEAALLAAADSVDVTYRLQNVRSNELSAIRDEIYKNAEDFSTKKAVSVLADVLDTGLLESLSDENIKRTMAAVIPGWTVDVSRSSVIAVAEFFSHIIDCKSKFTRKHTSQIANRAWLMAGYYSMGMEERAALYLAASLHDLGKIATPAHVLEKPGKLDNDEFQIIKKHVRDTYDWLTDMPDFELIRNWASNHHEKLDGSGYSFGKTADELDFNSRLMTCIDIYQAVCEPRPYHDARTHEETMKILYDMAGKGFVDDKIAKDMDEAMAEYSMQDVPPPA